jgi:hypothetical protein
MAHYEGEYKGNGSISLHVLSFSGAIILSFKTRAGAPFHWARAWVRIGSVVFLSGTEKYTNERFFFFNASRYNYHF